MSDVKKAAEKLAITELALKLADSGIGTSQSGANWELALQLRAFRRTANDYRKEFAFALLKYRKTLAIVETIESELSLEKRAEALIHAAENAAINEEVTLNLLRVAQTLNLK